MTSQSSTVCWLSASATLREPNQAKRNINHKDDTRCSECWIIPISRAIYQTDHKMSIRMVSLDFKALTERVGIVRILEVVSTCVTFSLVASVGYTTDPFWTWCMFSWCFCFCVTILILIVEFASLTEKLPLSWGDFTSAFSMLATLMVSNFLLLALLELVNSVIKNHNVTLNNLYFLWIVT